MILLEKCTINQNYGFGNCLPSPIKLVQMFLAENTYMVLRSKLLFFLLGKYNFGNGNNYS